jgi:Zn-finger nucleic acid-binding protein
MIQVEVVAMICPVCKKDMFVVEYKRVEVDYCHSCKGVWFDAGELELLLKDDGFQQVIGDVLKITEARTSEKTRRCPICRKDMKKVRLGGETGVLVDACNRGDGLWFDGGEVASLVKVIADKSPEKKGSESEVLGFLKEVFEAQ